MKTRPDRYRPTWSAETLVLHAPHALLGAFTAGLLAGPRWPWLVAAVALAALALTTSAAVRDRLREGVGYPTRSASMSSSSISPSPSPSPSRRSSETTRAPTSGVPLVLAFVAVAVLAGAVVAQARLVALDRTVLRPADEVRVRGIVTEPPRTRPYGVRVVPIELAAGPARGEKVLVRVFPRTTLPVLEIGREVVVAGKLRRLRDREAFERRRGVHAVLEADAIRATPRWRLTPLDHVRRRAERALTASLDAETGALARGMVLGQDHALPDDLRDAFRASGLAHLLAASGQNVMLLAALIVAVGALAGVELRLRLGLALVAILAYVPIAGGGPSIQRAGVMGAAGLVAAMAGRPATRWYALLLAASVTLALNPRAAEEPGWQLSFAAVIAILALHRRLREAMTRRNVPGALADVAGVTLAATLGTAPLIALHFEELSLVSVPANLLAAPAVAPVMWLGTLAGVLGGPAAGALGAIAALPLAFLAWLARTAATVPNAAVSIGAPTPLAVAALYGLAAINASAPLRERALRGARSVVTAAGFRSPSPLPSSRSRFARLSERISGRGRVAWVAAGAGVLVLLVPPPAQPPEGFAVTALDVGQGDAILVQHGAHAVLFDAGPPGAPVVKELREAGVTRLDAFVITHSSADHGGGAAAVFAALPVGLVVDGRKGPSEHEHGDGGEGGGARFEGVPTNVPRTVPVAGQHVRAGPIDIEILWPPPDASRAGDPNRTATVAIARSGGRSALLTADAESEVTLPLDLPDVDVLKVAHHGSDDPGLPALLAKTKPEHALIPVGRNTYGHPAPATVRALEAAVPDVKRTDDDGTSRIDLP